MTKDELFAELFPLPYNHEKWLADQTTLIERMKEIDDPYIQEQAQKLQTFQKAKQCSVVMLDIVVDRIKRHEKSKETNEKKDLTSEETSDSINNMM